MGNISLKPAWVSGIHLATHSHVKATKNRQSIITWFQASIIWFWTRVHHFIIVLYTSTSVSPAPWLIALRTLNVKKALLKITITCSICSSLWYVSRCGATREMNTTITLESPHNYFATEVHTLFCFFFIWHNESIAGDKKDYSHTTRQLWREQLKKGYQFYLRPYSRPIVYEICSCPTNAQLPYSWGCHSNISYSRTRYGLPGE